MRSGISSLETQYFMGFNVMEWGFGMDRTYTGPAQVVS